MNTKRIPDRAGFVGTGGKPKPWEDKYRRTFCSDECVEQHKIRTQPDHAAKRVLERDHGICCACGLDTVQLRDELEKRLRDTIASLIKRPIECREWSSLYQPCEHEKCLGFAVSDAIQHHHTAYCSALKDARFVSFCQDRSTPIPDHLRTGKRRLWEMDHITPVVEGGADCGLDNLRTLCWACHKQETAALAGRRAAKRAGKSTVIDLTQSIKDRDAKAETELEKRVIER